MRTIIKGSEPKSLTEYRAAPGATYGGYQDKDGLRACLVNEQRGLCCYCLSRIRGEYVEMKIEHWRSQTKHSAEQLSYSNLLGACKGNEGKRRRDQHCDTAKGDRDLCRNPANPMHRIEDFTRFSGDGRVYSDDQIFDGELNAVLNLNLPFLVNNRKAVLDAFKRSISKRGPLSRETLKRWLLDWNGESAGGELEPYCQVAVYWLRKKLAGAAARS